MLKFYASKAYGGGRALVRFPDDAIRKVVKGIPMTDSASEIAAANRRCGVPGNHKWIIDGVPHTWHHSHVRGELHLVPTDLHQAIGHQGRAMW